MKMDLENCTKNSENSLEVKQASKDASNYNFHVGEFQTLLTNKLNDMEPTMNRLIDKHNCSSEIDMKGNGTLNINDGKLDKNMNVNGPLIGVTAPDVLHPYFVTVKHNTTKLPVELDTPNEFTISRKRSIQALCLEIIPLKRKCYIRDTNSLSNNCERLSKGDAVLNLEKNLNQFNINDDEVTMTNNEMENLENRQLNTASVGKNLYMYKRKKNAIENESLEKTSDTIQQNKTELSKRTSRVLRFGLSRKIKVKPLHPQLHNII